MKFLKTFTKGFSSIWEGFGPYTQGVVIGLFSYLSLLAFIVLAATKPVGCLIMLGIAAVIGLVYVYKRGSEDV